MEVEGEGPYNLRLDGFVVDSSVTELSLHGAHSLDQLLQQALPELDKKTC